jgi:hypothetical protein
MMPPEMHNPRIPIIWLANSGISHSQTILVNAEFDFSDLWLSILLLLLSFVPLVTVACIVLALGAIPMVSAAPEMDAFPDIPFRVFSQFVENQFGPKVTLATVFTVVLSLTENTDLLNLHAQQ